jgi:hypothetical protein
VNALADLGITWGPDTNTELRQAEGVLDVAEAPDVIRQAAAELEPAVREATGSTAPYRLTVETSEVDAYWAYWLDGAGQDVRLRLNLPQRRVHPGRRPSIRLARGTRPRPSRRC